MNVRVISGFDYFYAAVTITTFLISGFLTYLALLGKVTTAPS